jgi:Cu(I)/Ag(I) efflux system membrane fusion protein
MEPSTPKDTDPVAGAAPPRKQSRALGIGLVAFALGGLAGGLAVRWLPHGPEAPVQVAPAATPKATLYQCPMHPAITSDHPGDCPICGMKLVAVDARKTEGQAGAKVAGMATVSIDPSRQQLIGLRTAKVMQGPIGSSWHTVARIEVSPARVRKTNVKVEGFVEHMYVDFVGQTVRRGQPLFSVYSPALLAAQNELLLALRTRDTLAKGGAEKGDGADMVAAARRRLELWDVPASEIDRLERTREPSKNLVVVSPIGGVVTAKNVVQGARVTPGEAPYEITDLGEVWVMADAYENDVARIKPGMTATLTLPAFPGRTFSGKVAFVDPILDPQTRTVKVHLHFMNPGRELRPGMYGEVALAGVQRQGLRIPADAVIRAGTKDVVFLALGDGKFEPRVVKLGDKSGEDIEVKEGLAAGQEVVSRANFLIDSESQLRASLAALGGH